jgi:hypothetical protein
VPVYFPLSGKSIYPLTFSHVVFNASRWYRSGSSIICSIFSLSFSTVPSIFLRLALLDAESEWSTLGRLESRDGCQYARVDHVHHFLVHFFPHAPLLLLQLLRAILQLANVNLSKITLRSLLVEQT